MAAVGSLVWAVMGRISKPSTEGLEGYLTEDRMVEREYARLYNHELTDPLPRQDFRYAAELTARADYTGALAVLDRITKQAAGPAVFNHMGLIYLQQNEISRAVNAFRETFARNED